MSLNPRTALVIAGKNKTMKAYKLVIVRKGKDKWVPTIVAPNGKAIFNEAVNRKSKLISSWEKFCEAVLCGEVCVEVIDEAAEPIKWPKNAGGKKASKKK